LKGERLDARGANVVPDEFQHECRKSQKGNNFPWLAIIVMALAAGLAAWTLAPTIIHAWRLG
jgi:hypothetical protein